MFYRRKIILSLIQLFEGQIDKISLQKLLFLFTQRQAKAEYDFIPYKYGCYSYSANADLKTMVSKGLLTETTSHFIRSESTDYLKTLKETDRRLIIEIKSLYGNKSANDLMKHTYLNYPYWSINSIKAKEILSEEEYSEVVKSKPINNQTILFTIGYEGISLEEYLNRLIKNDIKVLVDVRSNPLSMKYGFSKSQLQRYCNSLAIEYIHIPEVGIQSEQRQELKTQADYDKLFSIYRKNNLPNSTSSQEMILTLLKEKERIALTCFEANICQCHRKHLAEAIENLPNFDFRVKHI
jgi:uncharacterized protein YwgA